MLSHLVSVIIPIYNKSKYVSETLDCFINQTYKNIEVILVNDGSTDDSGKICDQYVEIDNRFRVIHQENQGVSFARRNGVLVAKGEYVLFQDADDIVDSDMIEYLVLLLEKNQADIATAGIRISPDLTSGEERIVTFYEPEISSKIARQYLKSLATVLFKRTLFSDPKVFHPFSNSEDLLLFAELYKRNNPKMVCSNQFKYFYRVAENSLTTSSFSMRRYDQYRVWCEIENLFIECEDFKLIASYINAQKVHALIRSSARAMLSGLFFKKENYDICLSFVKELKKLPFENDPCISKCVNLRIYCFYWALKCMYLFLFLIKKVKNVGFNLI